MTRYVAFLRGVSPMNCKMPELKRCLEAAGFKDVKTILSSGNVAFSTRPVIVPIIEKKIEQAMEKNMDRVFKTIVRPSSFLQSLIEANPFDAFDLPENAKRIVTFLRRPYEGKVELPISLHDASILKLAGTEVFASYVPNEKGPAFMGLLERTFGTEITTRTLDSVRKCSVA
jgi:uncharacterized protein (DUF1697 family)